MKRFIEEILQHIFLGIYLVLMCKGKKTVKGISIWYIPSEKVGQSFDRPKMFFSLFIFIIGLVGMHFGHFWPTQPPGGCQGG